MPDPQDPATREAAVLDWTEAEQGDHAVVLDAYRRLVALRRAHAEVTDPDLRRVRCVVDEEARTVRMDRGSLSVTVNLGADEAAVDLGAPPVEVLFTTPTLARVEDARIVLPPHAGAVVRR